MIANLVNTLLLISSSSWKHRREKVHSWVQNKSFQPSHGHFSLTILDWCIDLKLHFALRPINPKFCNGVCWGGTCLEFNCQLSKRFGIQGAWQLPLFHIRGSKIWELCNVIFVKLVVDTNDHGCGGINFLRQNGNSLQNSPLCVLGQLSS